MELPGLYYCRYKDFHISQKIFWEFFVRYENTGYTIVIWRIKYFRIRIFYSNPSYYGIFLIGLVIKQTINIQIRLNGVNLHVTSNYQ